MSTASPAKSAAPLHRQIYEDWREGILTGRYRSGERVPSTRELALTIGVARSTVTAAYEQLIAEGYLESTRGSGTYVCRELPEQLMHAPPARTAYTAHPACGRNRSTETRSDAKWCLPNMCGRC